MREKKEIDETTVRKKLEKGLSIPEIGKDLEVCDQTVRRRMRDINEKWYKETVKSKKQKKEEKIAAFQKESETLRNQIKDLPIDQQRDKILLHQTDKALNEIKKKTKSNQLIDYKLSEEFVKAIYEIYRKQIHLVLYPHNFIAAASVYAHILHKKKIITQKETCKMFNISLPSLRKVFKTINVTPLLLNRSILSLTQ